MRCKPNDGVATAAYSADIFPRFRGLLGNAAYGSFSTEMVKAQARTCPLQLR